jgi:UDP-N-acetylmuramate--alanine ligase
VNSGSTRSASACEIYPAREEPVPGVDGTLVVRALADERRGMTVGWMPQLEDAVRFLARRARPGDLMLTIGAGDVERAGPLLLEELA